MTGQSDGEIIAVPCAARTLARALARHADYRVLSRLRLMERREVGLARTGELSVCVLHLRAVGADERSSRIVELSLQTVRVDRHGRIVDTGRNYAWFQDPSIPLPPEFTAATGLRDADVRGRSISEGEAYGELSSADLILSHDPGDRPLVERRLRLEAKPWICSRRDLAWSEHGFREASVGALLAGFSRFYEAGGAVTEVNALLHLLDRHLDTGGTVMKELLRSAARPTWLVTADASAPGAGLLPTRGYRWHPERGHFWKEVPDRQLEAELDWVRRDVCAGEAPPARRITWKERYAG